MDTPEHREVRIDCPRCGKPVTTAASYYGREWYLNGSDGGINPEGQLQGGLYSSPSERGRWRTRVWDVSPEGRRAFDVGPARSQRFHAGDQRHKLVCNRGHRNSRGRPVLVQRTITHETLNRVCEAAVGASGRTVQDLVNGDRVVAQVTLDDFR